MPGKPLAPSLAESWTVSKDDLATSSSCARASRFHNGEPVTAEDVKFSFERYRGAAAKTLKERVAAVEVGIRPRPLPAQAAVADFLTFYATATGAGWIVPKKYVEKVGDEGFKKAPIGAGPYSFVSFTPGVELVLEALDSYWRKRPAVRSAGVQGRPRRGHAAGRPQARRGRHRLLDPGRAGRGAPAHGGLQLKPPCCRDVLALLSRAVGRRSRPGTT
jgi:peptide/nickel transport system substrate-binding protein